MRPYALAVFLSVAVPPLLLWSEPSRAQVSDSERAAARQLFGEGDELQKAGKYAEALDKYERAQRVFSAPTNLLRIAQCQAMLNKLVESAETYRSIIRTPLPPNAPPAFQQAVDQAKAELPQVDQRVPKVKIEVTPANIASLDVRLNGQAINPALIGEPLPLDPGTHKIMVFAPGYSANEQTVTLKERDAKTLSFKMVATSGGVVYGPGAVPPPGGGTTSGGSTSGTGTDNTTPPPKGSSDAPPPPPPPDQWTAPKKPADKSLLFGARLGVDIPSGQFTGASDDKISNAAAMGGALGIEAGARFAKYFYLGLLYEFASFGRGDKLNEVGATGANVTASAVSHLFGGTLGYISNPNGVGFYGEIGFGYRMYVQSIKVDSPTGGASLDSSPTYTGTELLLGAGLFIKAGNSIRIVPKATFGLGSFNKQSGTCDSNVLTTQTCVGGNSTSSSNSQSIVSTGSHAFIFLGIGGFYNIDLK